MLYDGFEGERAALDPEIARIKETWTASLVERAQAAEQAGHTGDALLLYAKASELIPSPEHVARRDELRARLLDESAYRVKVEARGRDHSRVTERFEQARLQQNIRFVFDRAGEPDAILELEVGRPRFDTQLSTSTRTKRYKSGTRQVSNPAYERQQDDVLRAERDLQGDEEDVARYQREVNDYSQRVAREGPSPNTSTGAEQGLSRARSNLERAQRDVSRSRDQLIRERERLADTPQLIDEDVYSDLNYTVTTHRLIGKMNVDIEVEHPDGRPDIPAELTVGVEASDTEHAAHPIANVPQDRLDLPQPETLEPDLYAQAFEQALARVGESLDQHRQALLEQAYATTDEGERIHKYIVYILLDPTRVDTQVTAEVESLRGVPNCADVIAKSGQRP